MQLYLSDFERPMTEKIGSGNIFNDPGTGGLTCGRSGTVTVSADASRSTAGEEVRKNALTE